MIPNDYRRPTGNEPSRFGGSQPTGGDHQPNRRSPMERAPVRGRPADPVRRRCAVHPVTRRRFLTATGGILGLSAATAIPDRRGGRHHRRRTGLLLHRPEHHHRQLRRRATVQGAPARRWPDLAGPAGVLEREPRWRRGRRGADLPVPPPGLLDDRQGPFAHGVQPRRVARLLRQQRAHRQRRHAVRCRRPVDPARPVPVDLVHHPVDDLQQLGDGRRHGGLGRRRR